jgi:antiviral helicase SKI2
VQKVGSRGAPPQRGAQRGAGRGTGSGRGANAGGGRGIASPARGGGPGFSGPRNFQQQDKNLWVHLVGHLREKKLLPVVIFTFSKKRCEENAATLSNTDLSNASEKSEVHILIEKAISRLKGVWHPNFR